MVRAISSLTMDIMKSFEMLMIHTLWMLIALQRFYRAAWMWVQTS